MSPRNSLASSLDLVVDASGPFQAYSGDVYKLVEASIAIGADYMDLADSSEFVAGIGAFDAAARARGVYVLAGVSSFPVLTAAVVRQLASGLDRGRGDPRRRCAFAFRPRRPQRHPGDRQLCRPARGADAGRRARAGLWVDRDDAARRAAAGPAAFAKAASFRFVDVPDLRALPPLWPGLRAIWIGAAPVAGNPASRADRSRLAGRAYGFCRVWRRWRLCFMPSLPACAGARIAAAWLSRSKVRTTGRARRSALLAHAGRRRRRPVDPLDGDRRDRAQRA